MLEGGSDLSRPRFRSPRDRRGRNAPSRQWASRPCGFTSVCIFGAWQSWGEPRASVVRVCRRLRGGRTAEVRGPLGPRGQTPSSQRPETRALPPAHPPPTTPPWGPRVARGHWLVSRLHSGHPGSPWARPLIWGAQPLSAQSWGIRPLSTHASVRPSAPQVSTAPGRAELEFQARQGQ